MENTYRMLSLAMHLEVGSSDYNYVSDVFNALSQWFIIFSVHQSHLKLLLENTLLTNAQMMQMLLIQRLYFENLCLISFNLHESPLL